jgi:hypothetical protein
MLWSITQKNGNGCKTIKPVLHPSAEKWTWEEYEQVVKERGLKIFSLEGPHLASIGDWVIRGVKGEFYPCKPDIFEQTYEEVEWAEAESPKGRRRLNPSSAR